MKKLYLSLVLACIACTGFAQTATSYGFTALSSPFVSIAGTPAATEAFLIETEDQTQIGIPLLFPFTYCGVSYSSISVCSNGWASLSMTPATECDEWDNSVFGIDDGDVSGTPGTGAGWLMPYWDDLDGSFSNAYYTTTGIAPNRVFTFEWNNWTPSSFGIGTGALTFQLKLYETTNVIDFCYGTPTSFSDCDATIGIANDQVSDWQTLPNEGPLATPTTTFIDFIAGSPVPDQVFRWTPGCTLPAISGTLSVCTEAVTTLSDATTGGTWSSGATAIGTVDASSGDVTGISPGTTVITYDMGAGCTTTAVVTVTGPTPIAGTLSVCQGSITSLSSGPSGGTWGVGLSSIASVDASGNVTGSASGTTLVSYTMPGGCYATAVVTVNPLPAPITGSTGMCTGTSTTLGSTTFGGTWTSTVPPVATIDLTLGTVHASSLGTTVISYTLATGCYGTAVVTVNSTVAPITGNLITCVGTTTSLASTTMGGTWASSNTNASIDLLTGIVTGSFTGTSTITYSLGGGCITTADVTVNPAPASISGVTVLCPGLSSFLSQATGGGTWISSSSHASINISTGLLLGVTAGTSVITYTLPSSAGSCVVTTGVTVNPTPNPITGSLSVCMGQTSTLHSTSPSMTWFSSAASTAPIGSISGIVSGLSPGTATITGMSGGCPVTAIVTVNSLPGTIGGTTVFCQGTTTTLNCTPGGGTWSATGAAVFVTGVSSGTVFGVSGGTATVTYTLPTSCTSTTVVTVNALPSAISGTASVCIGANTTLTSGVGGTWTSSNTTIAPIGSSSGTITGGAPGGTATVTYTLANTCFRTQAVTINQLPAAISGATALCPTTTVALTTTSTGGTWSSLNGPIASVGSLTGIVLGVSTGLATIEYTFTGTGCSASAVVTVAPAPPAVITPLGDTDLCPGDFVTLTAATSAGVTYEWYEGGMSTGGVTSTYITGIAGSYQVKVSQVGGCSIFSSPMSISVNPATAIISLPGGSAGGCSGTGVELDGTTGTGLDYQWEMGGAPIPGATGFSYTALTPGSYSLLVSNSTGCSATSSPEAITILASPSGFVTLSGPLNICAGTTISMNAGAGYSYQWYNASGSIGGATNAAFTTGAAGGYYVIETNPSSGCSTTSITNTVAVNPLPDASISHPGGSTVFCTGGNVALIAGAAGAAYQWYKDGTVLMGATNGTYVAVASGNYKVKVTDPVTGCTAMTSPATNVTVVSAVTVTPLTPAKFCWGGSSLLSTSVSSVGALASYQWFFGSGAIPGATDGSYLATVAGNYSCTVTIPGGCSVTTPVIPVVENPLPDPIVSFNGTAMATAPFYVTYQWYKGLSVIPGATTSSTPATGNGSYKVGVTDTNGCQSVSTYYVLTNWTGGTTGLTEINNGEVKIYPNPAKAMVHIESAEEVSAVITGIDGRELMRVNNAKDIDISRLADGVYMIAVYNNNHLLLKTEKLVKVSE